MKKIYGVFFLLLALLAPAALGQATSTTIMMYMCGTDLQSACVMDMYEMASVDVPDDVTIAVQAGGAYQWDDSDLTGEAVTFGMLVNGTPTSICREEGTSLVRVMSHVGNSRPVYAGGIGMILGAYMDPDDVRRMLMEDPPKPFTSRTITDPYKVLEELANIRKQGYAVRDGDFDLDTITFGAPLLDKSGNAWAVLVMSAPRSRVDDIVKERYLFQVRETANQISRELGFSS